MNEHIERARRQLLSLNPERLTTTAYELCSKYGITPAELIDYLLSQDVDISDACRMVLGPHPHEKHDDWREAARELRQRGWTFEEIASYIQGWYDSQNSSTVQRLLNPEQREKQRGYDHAFKERNREKIARKERERYRRNRAKILARRKELRERRRNEGNK
ncbi:hypothetical protein [Aeoliella sp.]|uniref:hypothetical protein n=1 Tax=Aeoliella sp. TaxID=2795800 RepID=UPI003CCB7975